MHVAYKHSTEPARPVKPTRKEMVQRWAIVLERKWRARDKQEFINQNMHRIKKLGIPPIY